MANILQRLFRPDESALIATLLLDSGQIPKLPHCEISSFDEIHPVTHVSLHLQFHVQSHFLRHLRVDFASAKEGTDFAQDFHR
jgi:hypothetical protein